MDLHDQDGGRITPYPDLLLNEIPDPDPQPDMVVEQRDSITLAFLVAARLDGRSVSSLA